MSRLIRLLLEYDGTDFAGFQRQKNGISIQQRIEEALQKICDEPVAVIGAGRTDAGVHALGQVCHFTTSSGIPYKNMVDALNGLLRPSIVALEAREAPGDFHARYSAINKTYAYFILNRPHSSAHLHRYVHWRRAPLDVEAMNAACKLIVGDHDFTSFQAGGESEKNPAITVKSAGCFRGVGELKIPFASVDDLVTFSIEARSFLYRMVRNIAGTLLEIGEGKRSVESVTEILAARRREAAGPTAPAKGLFLMKIDYPEEFR